jgi:putative thioredoxin
VTPSQIRELHTAMATSPYITDVTLQTFESEVLARSKAAPVLVDFWAAWCGPCKMLMPVLAKLADEYRGKFFLAKVDTDAEQALATRYGVKSLPTVKLFRNGQVVDEFMGVQPEKTLRAFLDRHIPRESDALVQHALRALQSGNTGEALATLQTAMQTDPANDRAKLELARLLIGLDRPEDAETVLSGLSAEARDGADATGLRAHLEFARIAAGARPIEELRKAIQSNPKDSAARYELAARLVLHGDYPGAMDELLEIVRTDRKYNDDAGRKAMLAVFSLLGGSGEIVNQYRRKLSMALN